MDLDDLTGQLTSKEKAYLRKAGYTTTLEVLCTPTNALQRRTGLPPEELESCLHTISRARLPPCATVAELLRAYPPLKISAGAGPAFDSLLGGGVRTGSVTEILAHSATGKSNLCMQLAIRAQLPVELGGIAASALYLVSETSQSAFPSNRLSQLARTSRSHLNDDRVPTEEDFFGNVHLGSASGLEPLDLIISHHASRLAQELLKKKRPRLGLIIVDSLAAPSRADFATTTLSGLSDRAKALALMGDKLKQVAYELNLAVVVVNQVSDVFQGEMSLPSTPGAETLLGNTVEPSADAEGQIHLSYDSQARFFSGQASGSGKQAALGLVWANAVDTRVMLSHTRKVYKDVAGHPGIIPSLVAEPKAGIRRATVIFSPFVAPASVDYIITEGGVRGVSERYNVGERWPIAPRLDKEASDEEDLLPSSEDDWTATLASNDLYSAS